jgi:hypothetical protein
MCLCTKLTAMAKTPDNYSCNHITELQDTYAISLRFNAKTKTFI